MLGQRVSLTATVPSQGLSNHLFKYEYEAAYELNKVTYPNVAPLNGEVDSWTYDSIGNRLTNTVNGSSQNYVYIKIGANPKNWQRLTSDGLNSYTYDANGNTATKTGLTFGWNYDDRLTTISGSTTAAYMTDYRGRRSGKTVGSTTSYSYDDLNTIRESGASTADYLFGPGIDEPLAMSRSGLVYYYGTDGLGSVTVVANSGGTVQNAYLYDAWGQTKSQSGSLASPVVYTGREVAEAGTLFYRARFYQPGIGRFLSEDPWVPSEEISNLYGYVGGDPIRYTDPFGLFKLPPDPRQLPPNWRIDPRHQDPNGSRYTSTDGDVLDFHRGRPGQPGWRGRDHYHFQGGDEHLTPGYEIPDKCPPLIPRPVRFPWRFMPPMHPCLIYPAACRQAFPGGDA